MEVETELHGKRPKAGERGIALLGSDGGKQALTVAIEDRRHLRRQDIVGAVGGGSPNQALGLGNVGRDVETGAHLHRGSPENRH